MKLSHLISDVNYQYLKTFSSVYDASNRASWYVGNQLTVSIIGDIYGAIAEALELKPFEDSIPSFLSDEDYNEDDYCSFEKQDGTDEEIFVVSNKWYPRYSYFAFPEAQHPLYTLIPQEKHFRIRLDYHDHFIFLYTLIPQEKQIRLDYHDHFIFNEDDLHRKNPKKSSRGILRSILLFMKREKNKGIVYVNAEKQLAIDINKLVIDI